MATKHTTADHQPVSSSSGQSEAKADSHLDEEELERLAVEAILQETKLSKSRAEQAGVLGWQRCPVPKTNKRFLNNLVLSDVSSNKRRKTESHTISHSEKDPPQRSKYPLQRSKDPPRSKKHDESTHHTVSKHKPTRTKNN